MCWTVEVFKNIYESALTHDTDLVELPVLLPQVCGRNKIPQSNGAEWDETEVDPIQKGPGNLQCAKDGSWCHEEAQNHQNHQEKEVDQGGWPETHA